MRRRAHVAALLALVAFTSRPGAFAQTCPELAPGKRQARLGDALVVRIEDAADLAIVLCELTSGVEKDRNRTADLIEALDDRRVVFRVDGITVRDLAFAILENAGLIDDQVDRKVKQIVGCQIETEWFRFHIPELSDPDFGRARRKLSRGEQR